MSKTLRYPAPSGTLTTEQRRHGALGILELADEIGVAELRLKELILEALDAGDAERAGEIVRRWMAETPVGLVESLEA